MEKENKGREDGGARDRDRQTEEKGKTRWK